MVADPPGGQVAAVVALVAGVDFGLPQFGSAPGLRRAPGGVGAGLVGVPLVASAPRVSAGAALGRVWVSDVVGALAGGLGGARRTTVS